MAEFCLLVLNLTNSKEMPQGGKTALYGRWSIHFMSLHVLSSFVNLLSLAQRDLPACWQLAVTVHRSTGAGTMFPFPAPVFMIAGRVDRLMNFGSCIRVAAG